MNNNKFDELARGMARSVTRRQALRRFGAGIVGIGLATLGLANKTEAAPCQPSGAQCHSHGADKKCCSGLCAFGDIVNGKSYYICV
jgi:hypothetical protein